VHHGDGVERMFWNDPRVLTVSVHESGRHLFPGTGWPADIGGPSARGTVANVALPPRTGDSAWLRAIESVAHPLVRAFAPEVLVTQHGCDTHVHDPLAHLAITVDAQRRAHESLHDLAHEVAGGRWVRESVLRPAAAAARSMSAAVRSMWAAVGLSRRR
jgi:acetoin utilization protein AcuC